MDFDFDFGNMHSKLQTNLLVLQRIWYAFYRHARITIKLCV